jgi:hypothetical protein
VWCPRSSSNGQNDEQPENTYAAQGL